VSPRRSLQRTVRGTAGSLQRAARRFALRLPVLWSLFCVALPGAPTSAAAATGVAFASTVTTGAAIERIEPTTGAQLDRSLPQPGPLEVYLLTIDRGEQVYEMFGHNALLIRNLETGEALAWNWGLFNFEDVDFIPRFLRGTMRYSMGPADPEWFLQSYASANRAVHANRVHLTQQQIAELDAFVRWNYLPENRPYIYDYYRDNCSTRVRDALDVVLGGALRAQFEGVSTGRSYRWFSRRQVQGTSWVDQGLSFLLGIRGDRPIDQWGAMFLPMELMAYLEEVRIQPDGAEAGDAPYPLLGPREIWVASDRPPLPETPPGPSLALLALGLLGGAVVTVSGVRQSRGGTGLATWAMRGVAAVWGIVAGGLGLLLAVSWWTDHHFIQANMNLLQTNPAVLIPAFALAFTGAGRTHRAQDHRAQGGPTPARLTSLRRAHIRGAARWIGAGVAALSVLGALAQIHPLIRQGNLDVLVVALPLNLAIAAVLWMAESNDPETRS
jgi:hypothetical protein